VTHEATRSVAGAALPLHLPWISRIWWPNAGISSDQCKCRICAKSCASQNDSKKIMKAGIELILIVLVFYR